MWVVRSNTRQEYTLFKQNQERVHVRGVGGEHEFLPDEHAIPQKQKTNHKPRRKRQVRGADSALSKQQGPPGCSMALSPYLPQGFGCMTAVNVEFVAFSSPSPCRLQKNRNGGAPSTSRLREPRSSCMTVQKIWEL